MACQGPCSLTHLRTHIHTHSLSCSGKLTHDTVGHGHSRKRQINQKPLSLEGKSGRLGTVPTVKHTLHCENGTPAWLPNTQRQHQPEPSPRSDDEQCAHRHVWRTPVQHDGRGRGGGAWLPAHRELRHDWQHANLCARQYGWERRYVLLLLLLVFFFPEKGCRGLVDDLR